METNDLADKLRAAIRGSGETATKISEEAGISQPAVTRFLHGADMRLSRAAKLAAYLGLDLIKRRKR